MNQIGCTYDTHHIKPCIFDAHSIESTSRDDVDAHSSRITLSMIQQGYTYHEIICLLIGSARGAWYIAPLCSALAVTMENNHNSSIVLQYLVLTSNCSCSQRNCEKSQNGLLQFFQWELDWLVNLHVPPQQSHNQPALPPLLPPSTPQHVYHTHQHLPSTPTPLIPPSTPQHAHHTHKHLPSTPSYNQLASSPGHTSNWSSGLVQIDCACMKCNHLMVTSYTKNTELYTTASGNPLTKIAGWSIIFHFFALQVTLHTCDASFHACACKLYQATRS